MKALAIARQPGQNCTDRPEMPQREDALAGAWKREFTDVRDRKPDRSDRACGPAAAVSQSFLSAPRPFCRKGKARRDTAHRKSESTHARQKLDGDGNLAGNADAVRLYHQLLGVRDQIAEVARRMPLETGELYDEDAERLRQATAALERTWRRWEKVAG